MAQIEKRSGLVEQQPVGLLGQRAGEKNQLPLPPESRSTGRSARSAMPTRSMASRAIARSNADSKPKELWCGVSSHQHKFSRPKRKGHMHILWNRGHPGSERPPGQALDGKTTESHATRIRAKASGAARTRLVLPAPLQPSKPTTSPRPTLKLTPFKRPGRPGARRRIRSQALRVPSRPLRMRRSPTDPPHRIPTPGVVQRCWPRRSKRRKTGPPSNAVMAPPATRARRAGYAPTCRKSQERRRPPAPMPEPAADGPAPKPIAGHGE